MRFQDICAQQAVQSYLRQAYAHGKLTNSLLLHTPEGAGGLPLALALANYLQCEEVLKAAQSGTEKIPDDACGVCAACYKTQRLIHPDVRYSYPIISLKPGSKVSCKDFVKAWRNFAQQSPYASLQDWLAFIEADNKQGNINSEECTELLRDVSHKAVEGKYKIYIIWCAEFLDKQANKLLKIIEEPPASTFFILIAENKNALLPTLRSRLQSIRLERLSSEDIFHFLTHKKQIPTDAAHEISLRADGQLYEALRLAQGTQHDALQMVRDLLNVCFIYRTDKAMQLANTLAKLGREGIKSLLRYLLSLLSSALQKKYITTPPTAQNATPTEVLIGTMQVKFSFAQIISISEMTEKQIYYIERNANIKLLLHTFILQLSHIMRHSEMMYAP